LVANGDNHLKNLSFLVGTGGIALAPAYDLLSTGSYHTRAFANERANWPAADLAIPLPGATTFGAVTRESILGAGEILGLPRRLGERELDRLTRALPAALDALVQRIDSENAGYPQSVRAFLGGEKRLISVVQHLIVPDMVRRLKGLH
jgi:serine/threonine-protein kinase HipA